MVSNMIVWQNGDLKNLETKLGARGAGGFQVLQEVLTDIADEAVDKMVKTIETVPSGLVPGKIGRVYTGHMRDEVAAGQIEHSGTETSVSFGWVNEVEPYFLAQEYGASNPYGTSESGGMRQIPPMHALLGAFIWAREELKARIQSLTGRH